VWDTFIIAPSTHLSLALFLINIEWVSGAAEVLWVFAAWSVASIGTDVVVTIFMEAGCAGLDLHVLLFFGWQCFGSKVLINNHNVWDTFIIAPSTLLSLALLLINIEWVSGAADVIWVFAAWSGASIGTDVVDTIFMEAGCAGHDLLVHIFFR
jgi:hypothetical protein